MIKVILQKQEDGVMLVMVRGRRKGTAAALTQVARERGKRLAIIGETIEEVDARLQPGWEGLG